MYFIYHVEICICILVCPEDMATLNDVQRAQMSDRPNEMVEGPNERSDERICARVQT